LNTHPLPRNLPIFLRSGENTRFELSTHTAATAPLGFQIFCLQNAAQCVETQDSQATYSPKIHTKVTSVNLNINSTIIARNDVGMDQWALNPTEGDCEDYALSKRAQLVSAGMPAGALRIATALTPEGIGHAVLVMRTNQGDLVLDNLNNIVKPFNEVDIKILAISGTNPTQWFNIA
jgi:predicted transglutaminase-like cysteine proteinase